jgi:hypothetical protein
MNNPPANFPLEPLDRAGNIIKEGDTVRILEIPDWLVHDLPPSEAAVVRSCAGTEMLVYEIDSYGYFWVCVITKGTEDEYQSQSFVMEPKNVLKV